MALKDFSEGRTDQMELEVRGWCVPVTVVLTALGLWKLAELTAWISAKLIG